MPFGTEVKLGLGDVVLDGVAAHPKRGTAPQFLAHVYYGQTAGWMKTPLGTEADLGPGHIALDGNSAPPHMSIVAWSPISATADLLCVQLY